MTVPNNSSGSNGRDQSPDPLLEIIFDDGPWDLTIRPCGPEIPLDYWPRPQLPASKPPAGMKKADEAAGT